MSETEKKVYDRYPVTEKERNCRIERDKRNWLRAEYRKQLIEQEAKSHILDEHKPEV